ncbi:MAG: hypothetical protein AAFZ09_19690, partial [Pseudomonadota bacterium]
LSNRKMDILRRFVLRRIDKGGRREFRCLCRMIPLIDSPALRAEIEARSLAQDPRHRQRALVAAAYLLRIAGSVASGDGAP